MNETVRYLTTLYILLAIFGMQSAFGQSKRIIDNHNLYLLSGTDFYLQVPPGFKSIEANKDAFVLQEKGSALKFAFVENIPVATFCDSLTDNYFAKQGLTDLIVEKQDDLTVYSGRYTLNDIPYIRAFYIYPYKNSTVLSIANYPEKLEEEFLEYFLVMFNTGKNE